MTVEWQPEETAPFETTVLTLWDGVNNKTGEPARYYEIGFRDPNGGDWRTPDGDNIDTPTHWMPLPAAPTQSKAEGE